MRDVAAAGLEASCWRNGRPGTPGVGAGAAAGSAEAVALSPSASPAALAAVIMLAASIFLVDFMVLPIVDGTLAPDSSPVTGVTQVTRVAEI